MDQIKRLLTTLSVRQRWTILVMAVVAAGSIYGLAHWQQESGFRPLYTSLSQEDASIVVQKLKESGAAYRLAPNGSTISVQEDRVAELRLEMAAAGVPKSGRIGFEIFDKTNFGMTDFAEHVNYRRALEGELERSVMSVSEIEQARVHISLPQESVFTESKQPAKASVLVKIRAGASLPDTAMPAITHLVASAVEGLVPDNVSVLDMRGNLLNRPKRSTSPQDESSETALEYRHKVEQDLTAKLDSTLEPLVGAGRFRTAVSADCDTTSGEQSEESYDPTRSVMTTSQKTEDTSSAPGVSSSSSGGSNASAGGVPGTASNMPQGPPRPIVGAGGTSRKTENITYQSARTVKHTLVPQGSIKKLSISVLLDQDVRWDGTGASAQRVLEAPSPERLKTIHDLVAAAAGLDLERGDQLIVESLPFEATLNLEPPAATAAAAAAAKATGKKTPLEQIKGDPKMMIGLAAGGVLILSAGFFAFYKMAKKSVKKQVQIRAPQALPAHAEQARLAAAQDTWSPSAALGSGEVPALAQPRVEVLTNQIRTAAQKDSEVCVGVLRGWLREERI
ncbi:MAG TPA: flagellar basal-body MS-ring/collar protein FliF [Bryobacteraceae bacterium]|jgi:flagellar M-ring protein FliF